MTEEQQKRERTIRENLTTAGHAATSMWFASSRPTCLSVEVDQLQQIVNVEGFTFVDPRGNVRPRPEVKMLQESRSKLVVALKELGMTPAARRRIEVDVQTDDPLDELRARLD